MSKPVIAIDMGGTKIKIGIVHQDTILASASIDSYSGEGLRPRLPLIKEIVDKLLERTGTPITSVSGLGISSPGIVDNHRKRILSVDKKFGDAPSINLEEWCLLTFGIPFFIENDARSALIGEWKYGNAKDVDNVILMTLGTGIGSAAVTEGRLLRGKHFTAGIMGGHFVINYKGSLCNCGNKGCVETEASTWNITNIAKSEKSFTKSRLADFPVIDYELIFRLAEEGDPTAIHLRDQSLQAWSASAINLIHAYDPEILVLTGGIMASSAHIIPYIRKQVETHAWTPWGKVGIREGKFPATAALLGIARVVNNG